MESGYLKLTPMMVLFWLWCSASSIVNTANDTTVYNRPCDITHVKLEVIANCTGRSLVVVPILPLSSTIIRLDLNRLKYITDWPFRGMENLRSLNLSRNPLEYISSDLFKGLFNLESLLIRSSRLHNQTSLDFKYLLSDLTKLEEFSFTFSFVYRFYEDHLCNSTHPFFKNTAIVTKIRRLELDVSLLVGIHMHTRSNVTTALMVWNLGCKCFLGELNSQCMSNFPVLKKLTLFTFLNDFHIDTATFQSNSHLEYFHIYDFTNICSLKPVHAGTELNVLFRNITSSLGSLHNFESLLIKGIVNSCMRYELNSRWISKKFGLSTSIKMVALNDLGLSLNLNSGNRFLPNSLKMLKIKGNCLRMRQASIILQRYVNIQFIDARNMAHCLDRGTEYSAAKRHQNYSEVQKLYSHRKQSLNGLKLLFDLDNDSAQQTATKHTASYIGSQFWLKKAVENNQTLSPSSLRPNISIREFYFSQCRSQCYFLFYYPDHSFLYLKRLELSWLLDIQERTLPKSIFHRSPSLEFLDLTRSNIVLVDPDTFQNNGHLKVLQMSSNHLGKMGPSVSKTWKSLTELETLNIADNRIASLTADSFTNQNNIAEIDVSMNNLVTFVPSLARATKLRVLNLSFNLLSMLSSNNLDQLSAIRKLHALKVDINGNPLLCNCESLNFLKWVHSTSVNLMSKQNLSCVMENGTRISFIKLTTILESLKSTCESNIILYIVCSAAGGLCLTVLVISLVYRYRWKLRYIYYMTKLSLRRDNKEYERLFEYDAFISYSSEDFEIVRNGCVENLEKKRGLKLCIHERDFEPGEPIAYNISVAIHSSKRTILFVSKSFLESEWCLYELNIARMESLHTKRTMLLVVILDSDVIQKLPVEILDLVRTVTYLEYPEDEDERDIAVFWGKLADFITRI